MKSKRSRAWQKQQLVKRIAEKLSNRPQRHIVSYEELQQALMPPVVYDHGAFPLVPLRGSVIVMNEEDIAELKSRNTDAGLLTPSQKL